MFVAPGLSAQPGAAAGAGAAAAILGSNADGSRGLVTVTTGASGLVAGPIAVVTLPTPITADTDAFAAACATMPGAQAGGAAFASVDLTLTAYTVPPAGVTFQGLAQMATAGQVTKVGIEASGPLAPSTTYRFGWRLLT